MRIQLHLAVFRIMKCETKKNLKFYRTDKVYVIESTNVEFGMCVKRESSKFTDFKTKLKKFLFLKILIFS